MSNPKQHHIVPQVYLRYFCIVEHSSQIYFFDKISKKTGLTNITNIAQERKFYTDLSQEDANFYEKFYSNNIEPALGRLLNQINITATLGMKDSCLLTHNDRRILSEMIIYQMLRTRSARRLMREKADQTSTSLIGQLLKAPEINKSKQLQTIIEKYNILDENLFKEISLPLSTDSARITKYTEFINSMLCTFYYNETNEVFITSDNPVVLYRLSTQDIGLGVAGLGFRDCIIIYPITPRLSAVLFHNPLAYYFQEYENRRCPIRQIEIIHNFNRLQLEQSSRQIYSQQPLSHLL